MKTYEYKTMLLGHVRGIDPLLESVNAQAAQGWRLKSFFTHESDSHIMFEREVEPKPAKEQRGRKTA